MKNLIISAVFTAASLASTTAFAFERCITGDEFLQRDPDGWRNGTRYTTMRGFYYDSQVGEISLGRLPRPNLNKAVYLYVTLANAAVRPDQWCYDVARHSIRLLDAPLKHMGVYYPYGQEVQEGWVVWVNYVPQRNARR